MPDKKRVLVVGVHPSLIDFSSPEYAGFNLDAAQVKEGLEAAQQELFRLGFEVELCLTDFGETAEAMVRDLLERKRYDCVVIGAGIRMVPSNLLLFEKLLNVVHTFAPSARICFNTTPTDTVEAVQRWVTS